MAAFCFVPFYRVFIYFFVIFYEKMPWNAPEGIRVANFRRGCFCRRVSFEGLDMVLYQDCHHVTFDDSALSFLLQIVFSLTSNRWCECISEEVCPDKWAI